jgi:hypothetical protein
VEEIIAPPEALNVLPPSSVTPRKEQTQRILQNGVLRRITGLKKNKVTRGYRTVK